MGNFQRKKHPCSLVDPLLEANLNENGYVVVDLLSQESVDELLSSFKKLDTESLPEDPFYTTHWCTNYQVRSSADKMIRNVADQKIQSLLCDYRSVFGYYLVKHPGSDSRFRVHQDWTMVNESRSRGLTVWCPLTNEGLDSTTFYAVNGSHRFLDNIRGSNIKLPYENILSYIEPHFTNPIQVLPGQGIVFDHRLWYFSPSNMSQDPQVVAAMVLLPSSEKLIHCMGSTQNNPEESNVSVFEVEDDFFLTTDFGSGPKLKEPVTKIRQNLDIIDEWKFDKLYGSNHQAPRVVFKDKRLESEFFGKGFFKVPLLSKDQIDECLRIFNEVDIVDDNLRYNSLEVVNGDHRETVNSAFRRIIGDSILDYLEDYKFVAFNLAVKRPGLETEFPVHIDDIHVNEALGNSVNCWIPLVDVSDDNGTLYVVPGSHSLPQPIRGIGLPFAFEDKLELIKRYRVSMQMKAGEALFFHTKMIHGSELNTTDKDRPAIIAGTIPSELEPVVFMRYESKEHITVEKFHAPESFYQSMEFNKKPVGYVNMGVFDYQPIEMTDKQFKAVVEKAETNSSENTI